MEDKEKYEMLAGLTIQMEDAILEAKEYISKIEGVIGNEKMVDSDLIKAMLGHLKRMI